MKKGEQGNLVIILGGNNSGKSNVLDALKCFKSKDLGKRDVTNLELDEKYSKPVLTLVTQDGNKEYSFSLEYGKSNYSVYSNTKEYAKILSAKDALKIYNSLSEFKQYPDELKAVFENVKATKQETEEAIKTFLNCLRKDLNDSRNYYGYSAARSIANWLNENYPDLVKVLKLNENEAFCAQYEEKFGINAIPNIVVYKQENISDDDLNCRPDSINKFLSVVLKDIGAKKEDIEKAHERFRSCNNVVLLDKLEKQLNEKVKSISKKFNSIYNLDDGAYSFSFRVESEKISLIMYKNEEPLILNYQSTGFRWFFDLYFNLLCQNTMKPGDIIIMDEPATNLHVAGQQELRIFLKDFAIKTGVTIVLATHSPFLVDVNNLDELRIVKNIKGETSINNDFSTIDENDSDPLSSITSALTVKTHILSDPDKQMVFVEGITDYNTLTKAVMLLGKEYENLSFLPVNGIGKDKDQQTKVLKKIMEIGRKRNPILLVDGDKPGEDIKKLNGENKDLIVISLPDIDPAFKELEDLFDENDRLNLGIQKENGKYVKSSSLSSNIKNYCQDTDFSSETKSNFKKVLDHIIDQSS